MEDPHEKAPPSQFVYADEAKKYGIPIHPDAVGVELHGFTTENMKPLPSTVPFRPILDRVLLKRIEPEATVDGFSVPEKYRQMTQLGFVLSIGHGVVLGKEWKPLTDFIQEGDKVLFGEYTAERLNIDGRDDLYVVRIQDIRGIVPK